MNDFCESTPMSSHRNSTSASTPSLRVATAPGYIGAIVTLTLFIATIVMFLGFLTPASGNFRLSATSASLIFASVCVTAFAILTTFSNRFGIIDVLIGYFFLISFAFAGLYQELSQSFPWPRAHDDQAGYTAVLYSILFLSAYIFGRFTRVKNTAPMSLSAGSGSASIVASAILLTSIILFILAGPTNVVRPRSGEELILESSSSQIILIGRSFGLIAFLYYLSQAIVEKRRNFLSAAFVASAAMALVWFNPISAPRFHVIAFLISSLTVAFSLWSMTPLQKAYSYFALFIANYLIFGPLKSLSRGLSGVDSSFYDNISDSISRYAYRVDFDAYQTAANGAVYVRENGLIYWQSIVGVLGFFVPRSIWPDKPYGTGILVHRDLGYNYVNLSYPLPTEMYTAGGLIGVVIFSFLMGMFVNRLSSRATLIHTRGALSSRTLLFATIAGYIPIMLRGSLNSVVPQFGFAVIAIIILHIFSRSRGNDPTTALR